MQLWPIEDLDYVLKGLGNSTLKLRNKKILFTGATGFIGKSLLESLLWINEVENLNIEIQCISRDPLSFFNSNPHFLEYSALKVLKGDVRDNFNQIGIGPVDLAIHAATDVIKQEDAVDLLGACIDGTSNILKYTQENGCKSFLLLSSGAVYGRQPEHIERLAETYIGGVDLISSKSGYALGKQVSEWLTKQVNPARMEVKVARCFAFVGPYLPLNKHFAIGNFIQAALLGQDIEIMGDGTPLRTYLYTSDLCTWLLKILLDGLPGRVWNVGGEEIVSIRELAEIVREELNPKINIRVFKPPTVFGEKYIPDVTRITADFGLLPKINIKQAVQKTAQWNLKYANIK